MVGRKKLDRTNLHARVGQQTGEKLKQIACVLGYAYNDKGSTGKLLDAIANGDLVLIASNKSPISG